MTQPKIVLRGRKPTLSDTEFSEAEYGAWINTVIINGVEMTVDQFRATRPGKRTSRGLGIYQDIPE